MQINKSEYFFINVMRYFATKSLSIKRFSLLEKCLRILPNMLRSTKNCEQISKRLHTNQTINSMARKSGDKSFDSLDNFLTAAYDHEKDLFVSKSKVVEHPVVLAPPDPVQALRQKRLEYFGHPLVIGE